MELKLQFVETYFPQIDKYYQLYKAGFDSLKVGMKVKTLVAGFCGPSGCIRKIVEISKDDFSKRAVLEGPESDRSILYEKKFDYTDIYWWQRIEIIKE